MIEGQGIFSDNLFMKKILFLVLSTFILIQNLLGQSVINHPIQNLENTGNVIKYKGHRNYSFTERSDLRVYMNGRYLGLQNKLVGAFIIPTEGQNGLVYEGNFYITQDTNRNQAAVAAGLHEAIPSSFIIDNEGKLTMLNDNGYPSFRSFPAYSSHNIKKGDVWQAQATRAVDPLSKGIITKMPIYVQYTYSGDDYFNGESVFVITAQWATRYGMNSTTHYIDWGGDKELDKATGSHKATLIVSKASGAALVIRDTVDETFYYTDGNSYQFKGTISLFTEYPPAVDRSKLIDAIKRIVKLDDKEAEDLLKNRPDNSDTNSDLVTSSDSFENKDSSISNDLVTKSDLETNSNSLTKTDFISKSELITDDEILNPSFKRLESKKSAQNKVSPGTTSTTSSTTTTPQTTTTTNTTEKNKNKESPEKSITVENTDAGIRLTMQNLQFKADSAELLAGEEVRLNQIAEILKAADGAQFLIEGHTASTGNEYGEMKLSLERAQSVVAALNKRGISKERFICKGSGGKKPVASNTSSEGKAKNRRVEITILE